MTKVTPHWGRRSEAIILGFILTAAFLAYNYTNFFATNWFIFPDDHGYYVLGKNLSTTGSLRIADDYNKLFEIPVFAPEGTVAVDGLALPRHAYGMFYLLAPAFLLGDWAPFYVVPLLSVVGLVFFYLLGRQLFGREVGLLATALFAFSYPTLYWSNMLFPDPPALTFFLVGTYLLVRITHGKTSNPLSYLGSALCFALTVWIRYDHLLFVALLLPVIIAHRKAFAPKWLLVSVGVFGLLLLPILVLNVAYYGSPFVMGYTAIGRAAAQATDGQRDLLNSLANDFGNILRLAYGAVVLIDRDWWRGWQNAQDWVIGLYPGFVLGGGVGFVYAFWRERKAWPFSLAFLLISLVWGSYILTGGFWGEGTRNYNAGYTRYLLPVWAFLSLYAALVMIRLLQRVKRPLPALLLGLFLTNFVWLTANYTLFPTYGIRDTIERKDRYYQINLLVQQVPPEAIVVCGPYCKYFVGRRAFDTVNIPYYTERYVQQKLSLGDQKEIALRYLRLVLERESVVYLLETPWHQPTYLGLEPALAAEGNVVLETVAALPRMPAYLTKPHFSEVRLVRVTKVG